MHAGETFSPTFRSARRISDLFTVVFRCLKLAGIPKIASQGRQCMKECDTKQGLNVRLLLRAI